MQLFYAPDSDLSACTLGEEESWHCARVMRLRAGDPIELTDGRGRFIEGVLSVVDPRGCRVEFREIREVPLPAPRIHIAIAPTKGSDRFEWFLEKATELGVTDITPLLCARSERTAVKPARLEKVLIAAMKQSESAWLPVLHDAVKFERLTTTASEEQKFIAWCETGLEAELINLCNPGTDALVLIGPEGDFSPEEVETARRNGFQPVSLGPKRLRTETAGIAACHTLALKNREPAMPSDGK